MVDQVDVAGLRVAYERVGRGPPLVLLHGYVGDGRSTWRHQLDGLSEDFTVVAWDAPGAGESADPPEGFGIAGYADRVAAFIEELRLGPVDVVGLSFGGALALAFQHRHAALDKTLVLASAYAGWRGSLPRDATDARLAQALQLSESVGVDGRSLSPKPIRSGTTTSKAASSSAWTRSRARRARLVRRRGRARGISLGPDDAGVRRAVDRRSRRPRSSSPTGSRTLAGSTTSTDTALAVSYSDDARSTVSSCWR